MNKLESISIGWDGPYTLEEIGLQEDSLKYSLKKDTQLNNEAKDYGVYQIYGHHPIYGANVLLYIGKAQDQTFAKRISQEGWEYNEDAYNIRIYIGRIYNNTKTNRTEIWDTYIDSAERMLIYAHEPARNSSNILNITKNEDKLKELENVRIFNYGNYRSLMPEVSGEMWIKSSDDVDFFHA